MPGDHGGMCDCSAPSFEDRFKDEVGTRPPPTDFGEELKMLTFREFRKDCLEKDVSALRIIAE